MRCRVVNHKQQLQRRQPSQAAAGGSKREKRLRVRASLIIIIIIITARVAVAVFVTCHMSMGWMDGWMVVALNFCQFFEVLMMK